MMNHQNIFFIYLYFKILDAPPYYYSTCINTVGSFNYQCLPGFEKRNISDYNCYGISRLDYMLI